MDQYMTVAQTSNAAALNIPRSAEAATLVKKSVHLESPPSSIDPRRQGG